MLSFYKEWFELYHIIFSTQNPQKCLSFSNGLEKDNHQSYRRFGHLNLRWRTIWTMKIVVQGRNQICLGAKFHLPSCNFRGIMELLNPLLCEEFLCLRWLITCYYLCYLSRRWSMTELLIGFAVGSVTTLILNWVLIAIFLRRSYKDDTFNKLKW